MSPPSVLNLAFLLDMSSKILLHSLNNSGKDVLHDPITHFKTSMGKFNQKLLINDIIGSVKKSENTKYHF